METTPQPPSGVHLSSNYTSSATPASSSSSPSSAASHAFSLSSYSSPASFLLLQPVWEPQEVIFKVIAPLLFGAITVTGFVGNTLVIFVIASKSQMRSVTNLLLLNLAIADLLFVLVVPPGTAYDFLSDTWTLGDFACQFMHYVVNVTAYVTVYTLVIVCVLRYLTVVHNASTVRVRTGRNVVIVVVMTWMTMLVVNVPIFFSYGVTRKCDAVSGVVGQQVFTTFFVFAYLLPLSVIAFFSACILRHISKHRPATFDSMRSRSDARKRQASRLIVLVVVVFVCLWTPVHLLLLVYHYSGPPTKSVIYDVLSLVIQCLPFVNSCVNPFIYSHASKDFRDAFRETFACRGSSGDPSTRMGAAAHQQVAPQTRISGHGCCLGGAEKAAERDEHLRSTKNKRATSGAKQRQKENEKEAQRLERSYTNNAVEFAPVVKKHDHHLHQQHHHRHHQLEMDERLPALIGAVDNRPTISDTC